MLETCANLNGFGVQVVCSPQRAWYKGDLSRQQVGRGGSVENYQSNPERFRVRGPITSLPVDFWFDYGKENQMEYEVTATCGCEVEVKLDSYWEYGCAGDCCPSYEVQRVESVTITLPCIQHGG
jgi:hypothetical protein